MRELKIYKYLGTYILKNVEVKKSFSKKTCAE